jgi:ABC-type glutathione transport system ATPase component
LKQAIGAGEIQLETPLSTSEFLDALKGDSPDERIAAFLQPYVESLEARVRALEPIYRTIDRFVAIVNGLLSDKSIVFDLSHGFKIKNKLNSMLTPAQLSSGEQQLLLLFCYVLTGRDKPSVFMIDEPELSLNIKWQRQLIQSLLELTDNESIQFVFASHSLELLSQHRDRVVSLVNVK